MRPFGQRTPGPDSTAPTIASDLGPLSVSNSAWKTDCSRQSVSLSEIRSGGPNRDGIPPIDHPKFETIAQADAWLEPVEPVFDQPTTLPPPDLTAELIGPTFRPFDLPTVTAPRIPPAAVIITPRAPVNRASSCCDFGIWRPRKRFYAVPLATPEPSYAFFSFLAVAALGARMLWNRRGVRAGSSAPVAPGARTPRP